MATNGLTCIDLFSGCGGFSLGMQQAGFSILAAIDFNKEAVAVFKANFPEVPQVLLKDLTKFSPRELSKLLEVDKVDVIVGGPPCQGFSTVRQRDGANAGPRIVEDERRYLYQEFLKYVKFFQPKVFVMENVIGMKSAANGVYFTKIQEEARALGYRVHPQVERAVELGVPQKRVRQLIIGTKAGIPEFFPRKLSPSPRAASNPTLGEAIGDLPPVKVRGGEEDALYDIERRKAHVSKYGRKYLYETLEVHHATSLTAHRARPHSERDLRDFAKIREGENCTKAMDRGEEFEFPYDKSTFKDRYTRQHRGQPCSTIVAHLSKDGLMFIHPTQSRSLTPREAARVQSFPDWFALPVARTHQFRVIGNAVPPLVGEAVGLTVKEYLKKGEKKQRRTRRQNVSLPESRREAVSFVLKLVESAQMKHLKSMEKLDFLRGWHAVFYLFSHLHPDSALDHGSQLFAQSHENPDIRRIEPRLLTPCFSRSGWPVLLAPIAKEAWRRYNAKEIDENEFYCDEAVEAGMSS